MARDEEFQGWMKINELIEKTGVKRSAIHYYYREKLLPPPLKTGQTMALYTDLHVDCLRLIRKLREEEGMPIVAVRHQVMRVYGDHWEVGASAFDKMGSDPDALAKTKKQRRRIIQTAIALFSSKGYHPTHVSHITDALHLSKGTFYLYFKNKHDLLVSVFDHLILELKKTDKDIAGDPDLLSRMIKRGRHYIEVYKKYRKIFDIIRVESIGNEKTTDLSIQKLYSKLLEKTIEDITIGQEKGMILKTAGDPELLAYRFLGSIDFLCYRLFMDDKYSIEDILEVILYSIPIDRSRWTP